MKLFKLFCAYSLSLLFASHSFGACGGCDEQKHYNYLSEPGLALVLFDLGYDSQREHLGHAILREDDVDITTLSSPNCIHIHIPGFNNLGDRGDDVKFGKSEVGRHNDAFILGDGGMLDVPLMRLEANAIPSGELAANSRGYVVKGFTAGEDDLSGKNKLTYKVTVTGGYKNGAGDDGYIPAEEVSNGVYEVTALYETYPFESSPRVFKVRQNFKSAGVPADDVWTYDISGKQATVKKTMEKLVVKNRMAEDTEFNVFTKTTMRDGRIFQTKDVQYFEYPELAQKGRNGLLSFDKAKGFRKDLRLVDKVCDVKPDGEIVVKSERLRSFNLGQGAGERETRGLVKSQRLNGKWRVYEYAGGGAQPSKIYSPEEAVEESSEIGVPSLGLSSLNGKSVKIIENDIDASSGKISAKTAKRGVLKLAENASAPILEKEELLSRESLEEPRPAVSVKTMSAEAGSSSKITRKTESITRGGYYHPGISWIGSNFYPTLNNMVSHPDGTPGPHAYNMTYIMEYASDGSESSTLVKLPYYSSGSGISAKGFVASDSDTTLKIYLAEPGTGRIVLEANYLWDGTQFQMLDWVWHSYVKSYLDQPFPAWVSPLKSSYYSNGDRTVCSLSGSSYTMTGKNGSYTVNVDDDGNEISRRVSVGSGSVLETEETVDLSGGGKADIINYTAGSGSPLNHSIVIGYNEDNENHTPVEIDEYGTVVTQELQEFEAGEGDSEDAEYVDGGAYSKVVTSVGGGAVRSAISASVYDSQNALAVQKGDGVVDVYRVAQTAPEPGIKVSSYKMGSASSAYVMNKTETDHGNGRTSEEVSTPSGSYSSETVVNTESTPEGLQMSVDTDSETKIVDGREVSYRHYKDRHGRIIRTVVTDGADVSELSYNIEYEFADGGWWLKETRHSSRDSGSENDVVTRTRLTGFETISKESYSNVLHYLVASNYILTSEKETIYKDRKTVEQKILNNVSYSSSGNSFINATLNYEMSGGSYVLRSKESKLYKLGVLEKSAVEYFTEESQSAAARAEVTVYNYDSIGRETSRYVYSDRAYGPTIYAKKSFYYPGKTTEIPFTDGRTVQSLGRLSGETVIGYINGSPASKTGYMYEYYPDVDYKSGKIKAVTYATSFGSDDAPLSGLSTYYDYDAMGNITRSWGYSQLPVEFEYNEFGDMNKMYMFKAADLSALASPEWSFDKSGASVTSWTYDMSNRTLTGKTAAVPGIGGSATTYDGMTPATYTFGNGDTISYSNGGDTESYTKSGASAPEETFAFTRENGNVTAVQSGQGSYAYTYGNDSSMPLSESYPDGHTLTREIDAAGNVRSVTLKDAQGAVLYAVAYTYNPNGSIAAVTAEGKTVSYSYNSLWQVSSVNLGGTASIDYAYDGLGMLSSAKYVAGGQTLKGNEYAYDALGKIISVNVLKDGASVGAWKYGYNDILSALTSAGFYTGTQEDAPLADEYSFEAYNYDAAGNITSAKRNASEASAYWDTHATDPGNRLVSLYNAQDRMFPIRGSAASNASLKISVDGVETQIQRADGQEDFVFALDNSANASPLYSEIKLTATVDGGGVNGADAVSMERGSAFLHKAENALSYDNSGNLISDGRWNYKWNARQRLSEMETTEAAISAGAPKEKYVYTYDWKHRKIKAQRYLWNAETGENGAWALVSENRRYYDEWNLIYEVTENGYTGTTSNKYYYGGDIANTVYSTGGTSGLRMANIGGTLVYVFNNQTGNVEALYRADSSNELLAEYEYTPFGETRKQSGELSTKNPLRYSTRYQEGNTGLYYYGFRHYSPVTKKWLSQDPIGEKGGYNLYQFAGNNPVSLIDSLGLCPECVIKITSAHGPNITPDMSEEDRAKAGLESGLGQQLLDDLYNNKDNAKGIYFNLPLGCNTSSVIAGVNGAIRKNQKSLYKGIPSGITGTSVNTYELPGKKDYDDDGNRTYNEPSESEWADIEKNAGKDAMPTADALEALLAEAQNLIDEMCEKGPGGYRRCSSVKFEIADGENTDPKNPNDFVKTNKKGLEKRLERMNTDCKNK